MEKKKSICISPEILTIILSDFDNNDFIIENKLYLKHYVSYYPENSEGEYYLISILCRNKNQFLAYFINIFNNHWYCYSDKQIEKVDAMDINDIPMMLIYQASIEHELISNYKPLKRKNIYKQYLIEKESNKILNSKFEKQKDKNSILNEKIKKLENQLKEEKNKNFGGKNKFNKNLATTNDYIFIKGMKRTKKEIELENQLKEEKNKNLKEKKQYEEKFKKMEKYLEEVSQKNKYLLDMINYNNAKKEKEKISLKKIIERYPFKLSENEKMITVTFCSYDENIDYSLICKNTDAFLKIENIFYDKYPEYQNAIKKFFCKGKIINRDQNLEQNKINNGDKIFFE